MRLDIHETSTLSTNTYESIHLGQKKSKNKMFLEILEEYKGACWTNFRQVQQKRQNAFLAKRSIFLRN